MFVKYTIAYERGRHFFLVEGGGGGGGELGVVVGGYKIVSCVVKLTIARA